MARYIIEIADQRNGSHLFAPTRDRLRGRWNFGNTADRNLRSAGLKRMAREIREIPGQHVAVDTDKMEGVIFDPLGSPTHEVLWENMERIMDSHKQEFGAGKKKPKPTSKVALTADTLKDWLWEMLCIVEAGQGVLASGSDQLPTRDEIAKLPGRRRRDPWNSGAQLGTGKQGDEHLVKYVDVVPVGSVGSVGPKGKEKEPAGA